MAKENTEEVMLEFEQKITTLAAQCPKGCSDQEIQTGIPEMLPTDRALVINRLLAKGLIDVFKQGGNLVYKLKDQGRSKTVISGDNEEKIVFAIIEEAGNKGIWIRDIRFKSNLIPTHLTKILKSLEGKKLIKAVKSVSASKKKVYMLYNLEPDSSITGGAWYCDQDFEAEFVDVLNQRCYRYLVQKLEDNKSYEEGPLATCRNTFATSSDVWKYIAALRISKVELSVEDIETILNTLVYDGKVERTIELSNVSLYRATQTLLPTTGLVYLPCGVCPVINNCSDIGSVNPVKCTYFKEFFE